ncbi:MAG: 2-hydroxyacid dehydrogenase [Armatimonadota bacterium]
MSKPKVFVTRLIPDAGLDQIREECDADVWEEQMPPEKSVILERVVGCDGLLCLLTDDIDAEVMDAAGDLKVISNYAVGYNNIDVDAATERGIPVGNTPGVLTDTTADLAWALLMSIARRIVEADKYVRAKKWMTWEPRLLLGNDVAGATLGIIGFGRIGQAMAKRATGFDMKILYYDIYPDEEAEKEYGAEFREMDEVLKEADFVTLHTVLNDETYHMIGERELDLIGPDGYLINNSRGGVIDQDALVKALQENRIAGAALDVTEPEPLPDDSPLHELDNVILAPHIGSASRQTRNKMARMAAANLLAGVKGEELPNCVNPDVL